ncbi:RpiR family transcriptional regulator [Luteibacter rhizovicinus]|uniref:RpiR family transcriptional regulator n=1 Tax=Luteibacter rhizovicinus TaxID=242606 RepID=A0A4V6P481_9GAMM|nr:MurR/RpiR family transcriptional regulator [Luteibacter rhizovicinus]TCV97779.1 RpiR family transcriptional regulator [Luteibacter rhizovicinus]
MTKDLKQKLKESWQGFTASERKIATYLMHNIRDLPFETAASVSKRVGVSPMTVGRFLRNLGYEGLGDLKEEFRGDNTWKPFYKPPEQPKGSDEISAHLMAETRALAGVHELARTKEWKSVVKLLASADQVSVASFQHSTFLGLGLAKLLQQVRPRVAFSDGTDAAYVDLLLDSTKDSCVVLIDMRRYFKQFRTIAEKVAGRKIPLVLIADTDCYWARELTPHVLMIQASEVWHSYSAVSSLFSLIVADVSKENNAVMERLSEINELRQELVGYIGLPQARARKPRGK